MESEIYIGQRFTAQVDLVLSYLLFHWLVLTNSLEAICLSITQIK